LVEISLTTDNRRARLSVTDHGPGVGDEELPNIFEPFYRGGPGDGTGFGLGLAIAQGAVEAHGGNIRASNAPTGGLRVEIELPLAA
jgi:two-component system OmpR family sensor kinase